MDDPTVLAYTTTGMLSTTVQAVKRISTDPRPHAREPTTLCAIHNQLKRGCVLHASVVVYTTQTDDDTPKTNCATSTILIPHLEPPKDIATKS